MLINRWTIGRVTLITLLSIGMLALVIGLFGVKAILLAVVEIACIGTGFWLAFASFCWLAGKIGLFK